MITLSYRNIKAEILPVFPRLFQPLIQKRAQCLIYQQLGQYIVTIHLNIPYTVNYNRRHRHGSNKQIF